MKKVFLATILFFITFCQQSEAFVTKRVTVSERIENSEAVVIGTVTSIESVDDEDYSMAAKFFVKQSSVSNYENREIKFYHAANVEERSTHCCGVGATYLLFLKSHNDGFSSSSGRYGAYEVIEKVSLFLDETWMRTSLEHAEILLYLHKISQSKSSKKQVQNKSMGRAAAKYTEVLQ